MKSCIRVLSTLLLVTSSVILFAQTAKPDPLSAEGYILPPKEIADAVLAPWFKNVTISNLSPDRTRYIVLDTDGATSIASMGRTHVNLGGLQVDTAAQRLRSINAQTAPGLHVSSLKGGSNVAISVPTGARVTEPTWSPDGKQIAFYAHFTNGTFLYVADPITGKSHDLLRERVKPILETNYAWVNGGRSIVVPIMPKGQTEAPAQTVANSPRVQESDSKPKRIRAYPSLLQSPYDKQLLEFYATSQLAVVDVATGSITPIGKPAMIQNISAAPDGKYFRVSVMTKPFSYLVPVASFGSRETIWNEKGESLATLTNRSMTISEPQDPTPNSMDSDEPEQARGGAAAAGQGRRGAGGAGGTGRRNITWRPDGKGLSFLQLAPAADNASPTDKRKDRVMQWLPPFAATDAKVVYESEDPIISVRYSDSGLTLYLDTAADGKSKLISVDLGSKAAPKVLLEAKTDSTEPREDILSRVGVNGVSVIRTSPDGRFVYVSGTKNAIDPLKEGPKPYLDKLEINTGKRERIFEGKADVFETATLLDDNGNSLLVTRQTATQVPNTFLVDRAAKSDTKVTDNKDFTSDLTNLRRETIVVTRPDGLKFQVKVTFPRIATYGIRLPAFFWFYPNEYTSQEAYEKSKRAGNKNLFQRVTANNKIILARLGYVVVEPDCPIIGTAGHMNDNYISNLRANLGATVDELDKRGWVDRNRLGIGGHSYGAFSTANALVQTTLFKAGIAGDGCYNRTLTPFGFQTEQRQIWDDRELYLDMSPLLRAEQMTGALLMYHGLEDQNVGTAPINSERMYASLEALGKPAALYMYPYEDHGQIAKETVLDQWARFVAWLDKWVKNPQPVTFQYLKEPATNAVPGARRGRGATPPPSP